MGDQGRLMSPFCRLSLYLCRGVPLRKREGAKRSIEHSAAFLVGFLAGIALAAILVASWSAP